MRWKLLIVVIFIALTPLALRAVDTSVLSQQIESVRRDREALLLEQQKLQAELDKVSQESQNLGSAVKSLDTTKKKLANDIKITQSKINSTDLNIKLLENNVSTAERKIGAHEQAIGTAIKALSEYDSHSLILELLSATNFSDLWRDRTQLSELSGKLDNEVGDLRDTKSALTIEKEKKEKVKEQALSLKSQLSGQKVVVEESQKAKEVLLAETKSEEATYQQMLAENLARQRQSEQDLSNLEEQLRITIDPTLFPSAKHGLLSWPLTSVFTTGKFGRSDCSVYPPPDCFHNGLDFRASMGTPVMAMGNGVVAGSDNTDRQKKCYSYGRWVLISYDNGLSSVYAHLSGLIVKEGERVSVGQVVAYSGGAPGVYGSGYSKAQHLHIGLFPSQGVEVSLFTTSTGCKQVYVPLAKGRDAYLDPLAYLPSL